MFDTWVVSPLMLSSAALFSKPIIRQQLLKNITPNSLFYFYLQCNATAEVRAFRSFTLVKVSIPGLSSQV